MMKESALKFKSVFVAVTGASGSVYAERLVETLLASDEVSRIYLTLSETAVQVSTHELSLENGRTFSLRKALKQPNSVEYDKLRIFTNGDLFAPIASGSSVATHNVVVPCSMGTMARIAHGISSNLIERACDVALKQKKPLVICPRETPFNHIHLTNMVKLSEAGAHLVPLMPAFYQQPQSMDELIDFMVGKVCESLGVAHVLYKPWNERRR